jgi:spoIIIJ-associated protein
MNNTDDSYVRDGEFEGTRLDGEMVDDDSEEMKEEFDSFETESDDDMEDIESMGEPIVGPDPVTGEPQVEVILDPLIEKAAGAGEFLRGVLLHMGLSGRIAVTIRHGAIYLEIAGAEPGLVIGHRGQNLDALQHLVNRMVNRLSEDMIPVTVDSDDYRNRRNQQLSTMVRNIARQVLQTGEDVMTEPLTPSERRLLHIAAGQIRGLRTESFGEGFFQSIKISSTGFQPRSYQGNYRNMDHHQSGRRFAPEGNNHPRGFHQEKPIDDYE